MSFLWLSSPQREDREGLFTGHVVNGFRLKEGRFRLDARKKFFTFFRKKLKKEGGEALEQLAQRSCGCLTSGRVQVQDRWGPDQPGLVEGVSANVGGL